MGSIRQAWARLKSFFLLVLRKQSPSYWATALVILAGTVWLRPLVDQNTIFNLSSERNWLFQHLASSATNRAVPRQVKLVMIGDDEYWDGPLHHRVPTDRGYLAALLLALDAADPSVIALDFDGRLPHADAPGLLRDYKEVDAYAPYVTETDALVHAIATVASNRKVVLSKTLIGPPDGPFHLGSDIYQPYGICTRLTGDGEWLNPGTPEFPLTTPAARENISCGYIRLMDDRRRVPPPLTVEGQAGKLDSFPVAIARAKSPSAIPAPWNRPFYGTYISVGDMARNTMSAHDVFSDPRAARKMLQGNIVIVGAGWNQRASASGDLVDQHETPIGSVSGAAIHANLAETVLSGRSIASLPEWGLMVAEIAIGLIAIAVFAMTSTAWIRLAALLASMALLFLLQWLILNLFNAFFDAYLPVACLGLHAIIERLIGGHRHAPHLS